MKKIIALLLLTSASTAWAEEIPNCNIELVKKIENCEVYHCVMEHPTIGTFTVEHRIEGQTADGSCQYSQLVPNGLLSCYYSKESLKALSRLTNLLFTRGIPDADDLEAGAFLKINAENECALVTPPS